MIHGSNDNIMAYHTDTMQKLEIFSCSARDVIHIYEVYYYEIGRRRVGKEC